MALRRCPGPQYGVVMRFGMRRVSPRKSFAAATTGKWKRQIKQAVIPGYGQPGMGLFRDPKRSVRGAVYRRTTFGWRDLFK